MNKSAAIICAYCACATQIYFTGGIFWTFQAMGENTCGVLEKHSTRCGNLLFGLFALWLHCPVPGSLEIVFSWEWARLKNKNFQFVSFRFETIEKGQVTRSKNSLFFTKSMKSGENYIITVSCFFYYDDLWSRKLLVSNTLGRSLFLGQNLSNIFTITMTKIPLHQVLL